MFALVLLTSCSLSVQKAGPEGPAGPAGPPGNLGPAGARGPTGPSGLASQYTKSAPIVVTAGSVSGAEINNPVSASGVRFDALDDSWNTWVQMPLDAVPGQTPTLRYVVINPTGTACNASFDLQQSLSTKPGVATSSTATTSNVMWAIPAMSAVFHELDVVGTYGPQDLFNVAMQRKADPVTTPCAIVTLIAGSLVYTATTP